MRRICEAGELGEIQVVQGTYSQDWLLLQHRLELAHRHIQINISVFIHRIAIGDKSQNYYPN